MPTVHPWLQRHREFLVGVERWFESIRRKHSGEMQCGRGCAPCCRGLFDISLPDALLHDCRRDATVFIASIIADFESYWKPIL